MQSETESRKLPQDIYSAFNFAKSIVEKVECYELAKTKVILVADDEPLTFELIEEFLNNTKISFKLLRAETGRKAYLQAVQEVPDLVITDWIMPEFDGPHLIKKLKANPLTSHIPVIVTTGAVFTDEVINQVFESGAISYFKKPIDELELIGCVISALVFPANWCQEISFQAPIVNKVS
jgi:PleD family two-component response regulator